MKKWLYPLLYSGAFGVLLLHAASPVGLISRLLPFSVELFTGLSFLLLTGLYWILTPDKRFAQYTHWLFPVGAMLLAVGSRSVELLTYNNFVFSYTHLDPTALSLLSFLVTGLAITTLGKAGLEKRPDHAIVVFGMWLVHFVLLGFYNYPFYNGLSGEDKFFEWLTFAIYVIGGIVFFKVAYQFYAQKKKTTIVVTMLAYTLLGAIGYMGIAGEEVSWGQRVLRFETPENYADINSQGEFNLHNNELIFNKIYLMYGLICVYVLLSPLLYKGMRNRVKEPLNATFLRLMTFRWYHGIYFIPTLIYVAYRLYYQTSAFDIWEEATEVLFATGMLLYAVHVYWVVKKTKLVQAS